MTERVSTRLVVTEPILDLMTPLLVDIDTPEMWWYLIRSLWLRLSRKVCGGHTARYDEVRLFFETPPNSDAKDTMTAVLSAQQIEDITRTRREVILLCVDGKTDVIYDPEIETTYPQRMMAWYNSLSTEDCVDILSMLCAVETGEVRRAWPVRTATIAADLTRDHVILYGAIDRQVFRLLCDRRTCPTRLHTLDGGSVG